MKTKQILNSMKVISWVVFIGMCIKAGAFLISFIVGVFINKEGSNNLYLSLNLTELKTYSFVSYVAFALMIMIIQMLKSVIFYKVIKLFSCFNEHQPFSAMVAKLISQISHYALLVGLVAFCGSAFDKWLSKKGVVIDFDWSLGEFIFMSGVVYIIGLFVKRGVEIQAENELTI